MATYNVINLGCKVNRAESDTYENALSVAGFDASTDESAQIVVVNTCTVTGEAEKKTRKTVRSALKKFPQAQVIVTGCAAAIAPEVFTSMSERILVLPKNEVELYLKTLCLNPFEESTGEGSSRKVINRARVDVKIQDGCNNACTFCIVHTARGKSVSRSPQEIIDECVSLVEAGVSEIVLTGINLGAYSYEGLKLADLLQDLLDATGSAAQCSNDAPFKCRFRISSIEPKNVSDELLELMAASGGRICKHLHLPLQSGSSKVLREMARPYDAQFFANLVDKMYKLMPDISISTDIIVGFPGETDGEFQETLEMARKCKFSKIHVFPYSKRENTPAASRLDQISPKVKSLRSSTLRALSDEQRAFDLQNRVGTAEYCVIEKPGQACTESYHEISVDSSLEVGALYKMQLCKNTPSNEVIGCVAQ